MSRPIALSGFMGAGKSTVGSRLARELGWGFVDLDEEVSAAFATPVAEIFERFGEDAFRTMEAQLLQQAVSRPRRVVALGGGAVMHGDSRDLLREQATWIHLDVPFEVLRRRVEEGAASTRPLWTDPKAAHELWRSRRSVYAEAPLRVDGAGLPGDVSAAVRRLLPESGISPAKPICTERVVAVDVPGASYGVRIGFDLEPAIAAVGREVGEGPIALLTDWNVGPLHADRVARLLGASGRRIERAVLPSGESRKRIGAVLDVVERLLDKGWQRSAPVVALGGGVLGDMAGLVAALTLRGVPLVQCPTTLLAMVDSSVGGKVGVDHQEGKNLIGAFHQPTRVLADLRFLDTLPDRELRSGLAEVVKAAAVGDLALFESLEACPEAVLRGDVETLAGVVERSVAVKADVVSADAREQGSRRVLNFGHTLGHAIEAASGWTLRHGEAVSIGMVAAAHVSVSELGAPPELPERLESLLRSLGLPTRAPPLPAARIERALLLDKKRKGDTIAWVLLDSLGAPRIVPLATRDSFDMLHRLADRGIVQGLE